MNDECRWYTVSAGDTLLELTAKSCCRLKGALVLDRIMAARWAPLLGCKGVYATVRGNFHNIRRRFNFVLTTLLSVRYKERRNRNLTDSLLGRKDACSKYNYEVMVICNILQDIVNIYVGTDYIGA